MSPHEGGAMVAALFFGVVALVGWSVAMTRYRELVAYRAWQQRALVLVRHVRAANDRLLAQEMPQEVAMRIRAERLPLAELRAHLEKPPGIMAMWRDE